MQGAQSTILWGWAGGAADPRLAQPEWLRVSYLHGRNVKLQEGSGGRGGGRERERERDKVNVFPLFEATTAATSPSPHQPPTCLLAARPTSHTGPPALPN